ncbi:MAG: DUF2293 domain-containing protein [Pseudomonadota bacterium]|nr:DUF2293 domain-containing protein [Pseudomonadota bacterium]
MNGTGRRASTRRQKEIARHLRALAPMMPLADFEAVMAGAVAGHLRHLPPSIAAWQALSARVRHAHTEYDALLSEGYDRDSARFFVADAMNDRLAAWGSARRVELSAEDGEGGPDAGENGGAAARGKGVDTA